MVKVAATTEAPAEEKTLAQQLAARRKAITISEFAEVLGVAQTTIYDAAREGKLQTIRFGSVIRIDPKAAAEFLRKHGG